MRVYRLISLGKYAVPAGLLTGFGIAGELPGIAHKGLLALAAYSELLFGLGPRLGKERPP